MKRVIFITTLMGLAAGLIGCNGPKTADDPVDSAPDDSTIEECTFSTADFTSTVYVNNVDRITFSERGRSLWGYAVDSDGTFVCMGAPGYNGFEGAVGCFDLTQHSLGDSLDSGDLVWLGEGGPDGQYAGLMTTIHNGHLFGSNEGWTGSIVQQGLTYVHDVAALSGTVDANATSLAQLQGVLEEDWLDIRWVNDQYTWIGSHSSATGYRCNTSAMVDGTYATLTDISAAGCTSIIAQEFDGYGWPWYRVVDLTQEGGLLFIGDPEQGFEGITNSGIIQAFDSSGNYINAVHGESENDFGSSLLAIPDQNGDGVRDVVGFSSRRDFAGTFSGSDFASLNGLIYGPSWTNGATNFTEWGVDVDLIQVCGTDIIAVGAMFTNSPEGGSGSSHVGAVYLYELDEFIAGGAPFTTIYGEGSSDSFGRSVAFHSDTVSSYGDAWVTVGGDGGSVVETFTLEGLTTAGARSRSNSSRTSDEAGWPAYIPAHLQWLFPTEGTPIPLK